MPPRKGHLGPKNLIATAKIPLPQCDGPKLHPFADDKASLEFVRLLSDPTLDADAHVFEVSIGGQSYALKAFKYYSDEEDHWVLDEFERDLLSQPGAGNQALLDHLNYYFDPFYNECRAYGKIIEAKLNGEVAVRCHGYLMLSPEHEDELDHRFGITGWNRPIEEHDKSPSERQPLRAIVKNLVLEDTEWIPRVANKMLRDLKKMRKLEIYAMDIKPENYKAGLLVDLSLTLTVRHVVFQIKPEFQTRGYKNQVLVDFDAMIRDQKVKTRIRAFRNAETAKKLRSYKGQSRSCV
ncbi:MAG: hypothetical protein LQ349_004315 [Xanthoria aureola]|nr:MAG: hypothetical protein LQ349_004315 [Xanthoria aureola]